DTTFQANPFLAETFAFTPDAMDVVRRFGARALPDEARRAPVADVVDRLPKMHRKTQLVASRDALRALSAAPGLAGYLEASFEAMLDPTTNGPGGGQPGSSAHAEPLLAEYEALVASGAVTDPVLYFLTGSVNKNVRSMALDGEVMAAVAGPWALHAYLDFVLLSGGVSWIRSVEDVD